MVAGRSEIINIGDSVINERCVTIQEALELGSNQRTIEPSLVVMRGGGELTWDEYLVTNIRIGDRAITIHRTGCIPEHESTDIQIAPTVVDCPADKAQRCGKCILDVVGGEAIVASMQPISFNIFRS